MLKSLCHDGLLASFRARIHVRPSTERLRWTLTKYIRRPRIVSTNIALLEVGSALYQVVVKIESLQSLERKPANGPASGEKNMVEYLVMQKKILKGTEDDWKIWGTVEESQVSDVLGDDTLLAAPAVGKQ